MRKKSQSSVALKQSILDTAERFFKEHGYAKTTLQMIADELGIAQGTVTYHFKNKALMLFDLFNNFFLASYAYVRENLTEGFNYYLYYCIVFISTHREIMKNERTRALFCNKDNMALMIQERLSEVEKMYQFISNDYHKGHTQEDIRAAALLDLGGRTQMVQALNQNFEDMTAETYCYHQVFHIGVLARLDEATIERNIRLAYDFLNDHQMPTIFLLE